MNDNDSLYSRITGYLGVFGPIGAIGGFVSDVLQPLAPLSRYVFTVSLAAMVVLILGYLIWRAFRPRLLPPLVMAGTFFLFSGLLLAFQSDESEAKGVLASHIPVLESLQKSLGLLQKDVAEIKATTARIEKSAERTEAATESIARSTEKMAGALEAMQQGFAQLSKSGGVIENASRAEEHYHNARLYEQRGDYLNARRSYNAFFAFRLNVLDPHLRYQAFLNVQEGRASTREIYSTIYENDKRQLIEFARILLFEAPQRTEMLKTFVTKNYDFAPAYYELSREYSVARKGTQSLGDKKAELEALETLKSLNAEGKFLKYFVDKELASKWLEDADTRLAALGSLKQAAGQNPVTLSATRSNTDWMITLQMAEMPREVFYKLEGEEAFRSLGLSEATNPATGMKVPNMFFPLKATSAKSRITVKYADIGNEMRGPFVLEFDPERALFDFQKKILDMTQNSWVAFRDFDGKVLVYFTHLLTSRCALKEIAYGINSQATPSTFAMQPCNPKDPYSVGDGNVYITAPGDAKYMTVRLTFKDGSKSDAVRFER